MSEYSLKGQFAEPRPRRLFVQAPRPNAESPCASPDRASALSPDADAPTWVDAEPLSSMQPRACTASDGLEAILAAHPQLSVLAQWANTHLTCSHCKQCTWECEVLRTPGLDIGCIEREYERIMALPVDARAQAVIDLVTAQPDLFCALRRCCFCGHCTSACQKHILAADRMRDWRHLFADAGYIEDDKLVAMDAEWNIFSAYRAVYGIDYSEFASLDYAATVPGTYDTLLFPGCSLASYTPELVRAVGAWMTGQGIAWALDVGCCGSPLMSAGRFERARSLREDLRARMQSAGITRIVTVCPGCGEELASAMAGVADIVPLPEVLLAGGMRAREEGADPGFNPLALESLTFFDSCHDRHDLRHGRAIRALMEAFMPQADRNEMLHHGAHALCCGAGGAVAAYDPGITDRRVKQVISEARATHAEAVVTMCPTCAYTIAQALLNEPEKIDANAPGTSEANQQGTSEQASGATGSAYQQADHETPLPDATPITWGNPNPLWSEQQPAGATQAIKNRHYLEVLFGVEVDWQAVFARLGSMWEGEYGPWLSQTFFS